MKKCGASILCVVLLLSLCACGRNNSASKKVMRYHPQNLYTELLLDSNSMREVLTLD